MSIAPPAPHAPPQSHTPNLVQALMVLAAAVVVAATGPANLSRTHAKQVVTP